MRLELMESDQQQIDDIRRQLSDCRSRIAGDVQTIAEGVRAAVNWKQQLGRHPLIGLALAALTGYWIVPSRRVTVSHVYQAANPLREKRKPSVTSALLRSVVSFATRLAIDYLKQRLLAAPARRQEDVARY